LAHQGSFSIAMVDHVLGSAPAFLQNQPLILQALQCLQHLHIREANVQDSNFSLRQRVIRGLQLAPSGPEMLG